MDLSLKNIPFPCAVAVSGGADSLALLLLVQNIAQSQGGRVIALTVDHGLRAESEEEAARVRTWAMERGIEHVTLKWRGPKPTSHLHEKAREARYDLLLSWCKANHISTLLVGHHQQDQEETFWLRLGAGSGLDGLACMSEVSLKDGITVMRPLLAVPKEGLKDFLRKENQEWIEDASNYNPLFFRGKFRSLLEEHHFSSARLGETILKLQQDADFIQKNLLGIADTLVSCHQEGYLSLDLLGFKDLHPALSFRLIALCVGWFSGSPYPPRSATIQGIINRTQKGSPFTAGGVYWFPQKGRLYLMRELASCAPPLPLREINQLTLWDNRFWIDPQLKEAVSENLVIAPLSHGFHTIPKKGSSAFPRRLLPSFLALWEKEKVVAVPHLCYNLSAIERDLRKFIQTLPFFHNSLRLVR